jgi:hypothetical protein
MIESNCFHKAESVDYCLNSWSDCYVVLGDSISSDHIYYIFIIKYNLFDLLSCFYLWQLCTMIVWQWHGRPVHPYLCLHILF